MDDTLHNVSSNIPLSYLQTIDLNLPLNVTSSSQNVQIISPPLIVNNNIPNQMPTLFFSSYTLVPKKRTSFTACTACQAQHCACDEQKCVFPLLHLLSIIFLIIYLINNLII